VNWCLKIETYQFRRIEIELIFALFAEKGKPRSVDMNVAHAPHVGLQKFREFFAGKMNHDNWLDL